MQNLPNPITSICWHTRLAAVCGALLLATFAFAQNEGVFYYAIEDLDAGTVVRRGTTTGAGIPANSLILAPNTQYRQWLFEVDTLFVGFVEFETPDSGLTFSVPEIPLLPPMTADFDGDGLHDEAALDFPEANPGDTVIFDPATFDPPLDQDEDNVYHFTTITVPADVTVRLGADVLGNTPVVWLATGPAEIDGILNLSGVLGHGHAGPRVPSIAGAGGYAGGTGATATFHAQHGEGPGGGRTNQGERGGGAGHVGGGSGPTGGPAYGNQFLLPLLGGSGGAGGGWNSGGNGNGGGSGGGTILIASSESITINGTITDAGGSSFGDQHNRIRGGGGGSGGAIRLIAPILRGIGTLTATGGPSHHDAYAGSSGRIRLEYFREEFSYNINPPAATSAPGPIFLPADGPVLRVVSVGGVNVRENPTGSFDLPDVTIDDVEAVVIGLEASFIPTGTVIQVKVTPADGGLPAQQVKSTPLAGTLENSTATASVELPSGFSRIYVEATWGP